MKTITVIIVSYNQEDVISRCLDSVLIQKNYGLKHIVVCDDCSKDHTWDVLQTYQEKYPEIMRFYRNERNLGIYPNMEKAVSLRGEADLYYQLSGDDALCNGWFEQVQDFIVRESVDFDIPIGIYSDWKCIDTAGNEVVMKQSYAGTEIPLFSLYLRGLVCPRSLLVNDMVFSKFGPLIQENGLNLLEANYDSQGAWIIKKAYYLPFTGSIYYSGVGISTTLGLNDSDYYTTQSLAKWDFYLKNYIQSEADRWYAKYGIEKVHFYMNPSISCFFRILLYFYRGRLDGVSYSFTNFWDMVLPLLKYPIKKILKKV